MPTGRRFCDAINSNYDALYIKLSPEESTTCKPSAAAEKANPGIFRRRDFLPALAERRHLSYPCESPERRLHAGGIPQLYREVSNTYHKLLKANRIATTKIPAIYLNLPL